MSRVTSLMKEYNSSISELQKLEIEKQQLSHAMMSDNENIADWAYQDLIEVTIQIDNLKETMNDLADELLKEGVEVCLYHS